MTTNPNNDMRVVADILLDATANFWRGDNPRAALELIAHAISVNITEVDGKLSADADPIFGGALLACVALTQGEIPFGETQSSHLAAARTNGHDPSFLSAARTHHDPRVFSISPCDIRDSVTFGGDVWVGS